MKLLMLFALLLALTAAVPVAGETIVGWDYITMGDSTIYTYILISGESSDIITSFHVYAPVDYGLITDWTADDGWAFEATVDEETGGSDLCWYTPEGVASGLAPGGLLMVTVSTPFTVPTNEEYELPGCFGNWGYEVSSWPGSVTVMLGSVAVPQSLTTVPEPASMAALAMGIVGLVARRRRGASS
jgi:hypothetical protein